LIKILGEKMLTPLEISELKKYAKEFLTGFTIMKNVLILVCVLALTVPLYAQNEANLEKETEFLIKAEYSKDEHLTEATMPAPDKEKTTKSFFDFINKKAYAATIDEKEEKRILREKWKELLKIDIFYPYFKAKEVEDWISDKARVEFFKIKGRPKFDDNQIKYIFKVKF